MLSKKKSHAEKYKRIVRLLTILAAICLAASNAVAINCDNAKAKVEHLICADAAVRDLDRELGDVYHLTLRIAADPDGVMRSQRAWLKQERSLCNDSKCLMQICRDRIAKLGQTRRAGWKTYHDTRLSISFEYLENRRVKACPTGSGDRCIALAEWGTGDYLIAFNIENGSLEKVAVDKAVFAFQDGKWITNAGPGISVDAEKFSGSGWNGIKATITCGVSDPETGYHAAGGECFWAVLSDGTRSIVADTLGQVGDDPDTMRSVGSIRFEP